MAQNFTSKDTSINKGKLPAIYRKLGDKIRGKRVLDYGCGRYVDHIREHLESLDCTPYFYDPYNRSVEENYKWVSVCGYQNDDIIVCSNVLNVIDDDKTVNDIIHVLGFFAKDGYITVYEGDKSGRGRQTGKDQYQRNEKAAAYLDRIRNLGYWAEMKNGVIHMRRE